MIFLLVDVPVVLCGLPCRVVDEIQPDQFGSQRSTDLRRLESIVVVDVFGDAVAEGKDVGSSVRFVGDVGHVGLRSRASGLGSSGGVLGIYGSVQRVCVSDRRVDVVEVGRSGHIAEIPIVVELDLIVRRPALLNKGRRAKVADGGVTPSY